MGGFRQDRFGLDDVVEAISFASVRRPSPYSRRQRASRNSCSIGLPGMAAADFLERVSTGATSSMARTLLSGRTPAAQGVAAAARRRSRGCRADSDASGARPRRGNWWIGRNGDAPLAEALDEEGLRRGHHPPCRRGRRQCGPVLRPGRELAGALGVHARPPGGVAGQRHDHHRADDASAVSGRRAFHQRAPRPRRPSQPEQHQQQGEDREQAQRAGGPRRWKVLHETRQDRARGVAGDVGELDPADARAD